MAWLDFVECSFVNLGGVAGYPDLYPEIGRLKGRSLSRVNKATFAKRSNESRLTQTIGKGKRTSSFPQEEWAVAFGDLGV